MKDTFKEVMGSRHHNIVLLDQLQILIAIGQLGLQSRESVIS